MRVVVEPSYVYHLPQRCSGVRMDGRRVWNAIKVWEYRDLAPEDLRAVSVAEVLDACHAKVTQLLGEHYPELLEQRQRALEDVARLYGYPEFSSSVEYAAASLSASGISPHGTLGNQPVTLADECCPALVLGYGPLANPGESEGSIATLRMNSMSIINNQGTTLKPRTVELLRLTELRCHICDPLSTVKERVEAFQADLEVQLKLEDDKIAKLCRYLHAVTGKDALVLGVLPEGFPAYSALRQLDPQLPVLAAQALLKPVAVRRGIGVPTMRGLVPSTLWDRFPTPVRAFVLEATETFAAPGPLSPRLPTERELEELSEPRRAIGLREYLRQYNPDRYDREHPEVLGLVGLRQAVNQYRMNDRARLDESEQIDQLILRRLQESPAVADFEQSIAAGRPFSREFEAIGMILAVEPLFKTSLLEFVRAFQPRRFVEKYVSVLPFIGLKELASEVSERVARIRSTPLPDWTGAVIELKSALYDDDIEQSLRLQGVLNLYPLHKRVLGLIEYVLAPKLRDQLKLVGDTSKLWTDAFLEGAPSLGLQPPVRPPARQNLDKWATLETEGNWLIVAGEHAARGATGPLDLAHLMDEVVARLTTAPEASGPTITLAPTSPQSQARQLAALAEPGNQLAACRTLYLGKLALALRNAVEHGADKVDNDRLRIHSPGYWKRNRSPKKTPLPTFDWVKNTAATTRWRFLGKLPAGTAAPLPANGFCLTPASLRRCLTMLTLVLNSAMSHLRI